MRRQLVHARAAFDAEAHRGSSRVFGSTSSALRPALLAVALAMVTACEFRPDALVAFDASVGVDAPILELGARHDADAPDAGARDATNDAARDDAEPDDTADTQPADVAPGDGAEDDAAMPDGAAPDAAPDAAAPDAAAPDAAAPDAQPLDAAPMDARAPDAAPMDAAPMDARPPDAALDAGVDAGAIDGGCASPPWAVGPMPGVVATIPANIAQIDQPPLVADLDNDGMEEVALVSSTTGQLAIIDWPACSASPNITTALFFAGPGGIGWRCPTGAR